MTIQSKLSEPFDISCHATLHPWTKSCGAASAGILLGSIEPSLRTYLVVYVLALVMRKRIPTLKDLQRTVQGMLRSTAFLCTNAYGFVMWTCILRRTLGRFYWGTAAFLPTSLGAAMAISLERAERRAPLALYVANVGTETMWHMLEARGLVRSIPNGQVLIFATSVTALLYLYRLGLHKFIDEDVIFKVFSTVLGQHEAGPIMSAQHTGNKNARRSTFPLTTINGCVQAYDSLINGKHKCCTHKSGCVPYAVLGGLKPFLGGVGLQVGLRLLMNIVKIVQLRMDWRKQILNANNLQLGLFLGWFGFLYKSVSCTLRHVLGQDDPRYAIPAGLIGSIAFLKFPNVPVAIYIMWKALQLYYNWGIATGMLPEIPHFTSFLYSFFTGLLFHAAILEADTLRPNYFTFLDNISSGRLSRFNLRNFDVFGQNSYQRHKDTITKLRIDTSQPMPSVPFVI